MNIRNIIRFHTVIILLLITMTIPSCSLSKNFRLQEGFAQFSFNYPSDYSIIRIDINPEHGYSSVVLGTPIPDEYKDVAFFDLSTDYETLPMIEIEVRLRSDDCPDSLTARNNQIMHIKTAYNDFRMLSQKSITVSGIECTQIEYSCTKPNWQQPLVYTDVFFDYDNSVWRIYTTPQEDEAEKSMSAFEHVTKSFKILNDVETSDPEYSKFNWTDEKVCLSFTYPRRICLINARYTTSSWTHTNIDFSKPMIGDEVFGEKTILQIKVTDMSSRFLDFPEYKDYISHRYRNIELMDKKPVSLFDTSGEEITYKKLWNPGVGENIKVVREVFFNHGESLWNIIMMSDNATAEDDNEVFEQILKTFKILD